MHALIDRTLATVETASLDLAPRRFGRVVACDGGLIEVSGLGVPIGTICAIAQGAATEHRAETIGFRNGHTMMMMLGDTVLFAHVVEQFVSLAEKDEPVTVLLRADAMKMAFLLPADVRVLGVNFDHLRKDLGYRRRVTEDIFKAHYRLVVHTDYLRHPDLDEALLAAAQAPEAVAMEPRPWRKYDARLAANRALYTRLFDSGPPVQDKIRPTPSPCRRCPIRR